MNKAQQIEYLQLREEEIRRLSVRDFPLYAAAYLKIRTKADGVKPLILNSAQRLIHKHAEDMLRDKGHVRIILLKGRQQGASTYIEGRFYWKVTSSPGVRAFILTHEGDATKNLFEMAKRFHENLPVNMRQSTSRDSGNELSFDKLDSGYRVGTAGSKDTGRSSTIQYFHGSEVAFWDNAQDHTRGVMQAIPQNAGEVWLESTSDGVGNYFYQMWRLAEQGKNEYLPLFVPWFLQKEYSLDVEIKRSDEEDRYAEMIHDYHGYSISDNQLAFRRGKIVNDFGGDEESFKREYPATPQEAFESAGVNQLIPSDIAGRAFAEKKVEAIGPLVMGVDCARFGNDRTVIYHRKGRRATRLETLEGRDQMEITGVVKGYLDRYRYDRCFIDVGMGVGVIDRLHEMGYSMVQGVDFGSKAFDSEKYINRRNEMYGEALLWMKDSPVFIEDARNETMDDLCSVHYKFDSKNRKVLEAKSDTKKRLGSSPDSADAFVLTFAEPVEVVNEEEEFYEPPRKAGAMGY
jgi:hypothetical protein